MLRSEGGRNLNTVIRIALGRRARPERRRHLRAAGRGPAGHRPLPTAGGHRPGGRARHLAHPPLPGQRQRNGNHADCGQPAGGFVWCGKFLNMVDCGALPGKRT